MLKKVASNTIAQIFSKISTAIISIFLISILTNYLSQELFWIYSKIYNYLWIFAFLADLWLYTIMVREISAWKENKEKIVWNVLTLRLFLWIIITFLALIIAYFIPSYSSKLQLIVIFIASIFTIFSLLNSSILALMQSELKMEFSLFSVVAWKLVNLWIIICIVYLFFKSPNSLEIPFIWIFIAWTIWIIVNTFLNFLYAKKICSIKFLFDYKYIKHIFKISLPYWIALFLSMVYFKVDVIIISIIEPENLANLSIALYSLPMKIVEVLMVVWVFYLNSILPRLSFLFKNKSVKNNLEIDKLLNISFKVLFSFWILLFTIWTLFSEHIIRIIANDSYLNPINSFNNYNSVDAFFIVLLIVVFYFISSLFIYVFIWAEKQSIMLKINIFITIFNIIWNILIIPHYSFIGSWIITLISQIILFFSTYYFSRKIYPFKIPIIFVSKLIFLSSIIYFLFEYILNSFSIWLYLDLIIYSSIILFIYFLFLFFEFKKLKTFCN